MEIEQVIKRERAFYESGKTRGYAFRERMLKALEKGIRKYEREICEALYYDLHKAKQEAYMTEIGMVQNEIRYVRRNFKSWGKSKKVKTPSAQFPAKSFTVAEPYGVVLIMSPWNYPFMLCMGPLIGAIAAGNCAVLKPSADAPATSSVIYRLIKDTLPAGFVTVVEGGREENTRLLEQKFDYIFFTGGAKVGRIVMKSAADYLTPVTLELGGKSPCIIDQTANIRLAAKRIVFGKLLNSGQTCVAPDYVLIHESKQEEFIAAAGKWIHRMLGRNPLSNKNYPRMVNEKHFNRVNSLIEDEKIAVGGNSHAETLQIEPTVLRNVSWSDPIMQEEIFGPVLPVIPYRDLSDALEHIKERGKPLALYLFTRNRKMENYVLDTVSFGGGCVNDTIVHLATSFMGFGGVGASGMGSYHGKDGFDTFTHRKSVLKKGSLDLPTRYHPYNKRKFGLVRLFMK